MRLNRHNDELEMNEHRAQPQEVALRSPYVPLDSAADPESLDEDIPPPVPPKDYPMVPQVVSRAGPSLGMLSGSTIPETGSWVHRDQYDTEDAMNEMEFGPKVRLSLSRRKCLGIAVSFIRWFLL